eukprot:4479708-Prymnesium_polylepis.1
MACEHHGAGAPRFEDVDCRARGGCGGRGQQGATGPYSPTCAPPELKRRAVLLAALPLPPTRS